MSINKIIKKRNGLIKRHINKLEPNSFVIGMYLRGFINFCCNSYCNSMRFKAAIKQKNPCINRGLVIINGGGIGIRTLDRLLTYASFQDWCIQPLCHPTLFFYQQLILNQGADYTAPFLSDKLELLFWCNFLCFFFSFAFLARIIGCSRDRFGLSFYFKGLI